MPFPTAQPGALAGAGKQGRTECKESRGIEKDLGAGFSEGSQDVAKTIEIHSIELAFVPRPGRNERCAVQDGIAAVHLLRKFCGVRQVPRNDFELWVPRQRTTRQCAHHIPLLEELLEQSASQESCASSEEHPPVLHNRSINSSFEIRDLK